ncbi:AAA family ATPase [Brooklawnia propionicigenes]|nr:AAA family ATPase [Brooklawnia sp. SH051]
MALGAKVRVPPPRRELLDRTRLANPLLRPDHLPRLVLIAAPPGFGKTTLLTQWLAQLTGARGHPGEPPRIAWVSLDESDTDARRFVADLVESLAAGGSASVAEALALLAAGRPVPAEQVLATVVNGLDVEGTTVIALDDFHRAAGPEVHEALAFLLENLPPQVVVAMTTRADPQLPLARMRSRGELVEVRAADLRFTTEESAGFLRAVMDLDLDQAQVEALEARTEGWVAGLQLAALSVRPRVSSPAAVDDFIRAFGGSHRFVLDYLVEEVLNAQPAGVREFLLLTSVLERMTGTLCDAVTGSSDGQQRLEQLESAQVFVTALDTERRWFRYHQLFAEALRARLSAEWPDRVAALHLAASRGYASLGLLEDALDQAALADDPEWFADLVECALPGTRKRRGDRQLLGWISVLPDDLVRRRPVLATTRAAPGQGVATRCGSGGSLDVLGSTSVEDQETNVSSEATANQPGRAYPAQPQVPEAARALVEFVPTKDFFVGIDSDGCAMDAMDIKHQECFTPCYIKYWDLQPISTIARETAIFVNLGSVTRGLNRWLALRQLLDLLRDRADVAERGVTIPEYPELTDFIESPYPLSDSGIAAWAAANPSATAERMIAWGNAVNASIAAMVHGCGPFPGVREAMHAMYGHVDEITVSATPMEALRRE